MPAINRHYLNLPEIKLDAGKEMKIIYLIRFIRDLVNKLAIFFLPIYLYQHGAHDQFWSFLPGNELQRGVLLLVLFYLIHRLTVALTAIPVGKIITKIGYQKSMLVGFGLYAIFISLLYVTQNPGWLLLLAALVNGVETSFFWNSYFTLVSKFTLRRHMGQDMGLVQFLLQLSQAIAPAFGGLIILTFGFSSLFMAGLIGVVLAIIVTLQLETNNESDRVSFSEFKTWLGEKSYLRLASSQGGRYINDASLVLWPLYIFLILGSVDRVGYLYAFSLFLALMISFLVGSYIDKKADKKPFFLSGGILSFLWLARTQVASFWHIVIIDTVNRVTSNFHWVFFGSMMMKRGKGSQALSYFVYREVITSFFAIIFWLLVGGLFLVFDNAWTPLFLMASVGVMMSLAIKEQR